MRNAKTTFTFNTLRKSRHAINDSGITLIELLISIAILGIIMTSLYQVTGTTLSAYDATTNKRDLLAQARYAMDRMAMFVQETDDIDQPPTGQFKAWLEVSERVLDTYNNTTHAYVIAGDGYLDADNDSDGLVNEDEVNPDPKEYVRFDLDKSVGTNWKLTEVRPDYSTAALADTAPQQVVCEHVTFFRCTRFADGLVQIELTLNDGKNQVSLKTRVKAMYIN